jgi:hypothetical protein
MSRIATARLAEAGKTVHVRHLTTSDDRDLGLISTAAHDTAHACTLAREALQLAGLKVGPVLLRGDEIVAYGPETTSGEGTPEDAADGSSTVDGTGAGGTEAARPHPAMLTRAGVLRRIADLVADGMPVPSGIDLHCFCSKFELDFHNEDATAEAVERWASALDLAPPMWGAVNVRNVGQGEYRIYRTSGRAFGLSVEVTAYVDIDKDSTGLEGTGWLEQVWVAAERKSVWAHRPDGDERTPCGRSTRTGTITTARKAQDRWTPSWCRKCWPDGSPITVDGAA